MLSIICQRLLLDVATVSESQHRIRKTVHPLGIGERVYVQIRFDKLGTPPDRQGRREDHNRNFVDAEPLYRGVEILAHVGVVCVALVNHDDLPGESSVP